MNVLRWIALVLALIVLAISIYMMLLTREGAWFIAMCGWGTVVIDDLWRISE